MIGLGDTIEDHMVIAIRMRSSERYEIFKKACAIKSGKTVPLKEENYNSVQYLHHLRSHSLRIGEALSK